MCSRYWDLRALPDLSYPELLVPGDGFEPPTSPSVGDNQHPSDLLSFTTVLRYTGSVNFVSKIFYQAQVALLR